MGARYCSFSGRGNRGVEKIRKILEGNNVKGKKDIKLKIDWVRTYL